MPNGINMQYNIILYEVNYFYWYLNYKKNKGIKSIQVKIIDCIYLWD